MKSTRRHFKFFWHTRLKVKNLLLSKSVNQIEGPVIFGASIQRKLRSQWKHNGRQISVENDRLVLYFYDFLPQFRKDISETICGTGGQASKNVKLALDFYNNINGIRYLSNKSAYITKVRRKVYLRMYPTLLVLPDGSTNTIRHFEPRRIIKLPLDLTTVSEELRQEILERRKPKKKVIIKEELEDEFDSSQYVRLLQKKKVAG